MTTLRERLAKMTNEELAEFIKEHTVCLCCPFKDKECLNPEFDDCKDVMLNWLEQEYDDNI